MKQNNKKRFLTTLLGTLSAIPLVNMLKGKETIRTRYGSKNLNLQYEILKRNKYSCL